MINAIELGLTVAVSVSLFCLTVIFVIIDNKNGKIKNSTHILALSALLFPLFCWVCS